MSQFSWPQMASLPADEHLSPPQIQSKTAQQFVTELQSARQLAEQHPSAQNDLALGRALKAVGETTEAVKFFDHALEKNPILSDAWLERGLIDSDQGNWSKAAEVFRRAIAADSNNGSAHLELGEMLLRRGDFDDALGEFKRALTVSPPSCGPHQGLGLIYLQQGKAEVAAGEFRQALGICPDYLDAEKGLARAMAHEHKWVEAAAMLQKIVAANPDSSEEAFSLATALANSGDKVRAEQESARARAISEKELIVLRAQGESNWAVALRNEGRLQEAEVAFQEAIKDDSGYCDAHNGLGEVRWLQKNFQSALAEFQVAVRCNPDSATARNNLGASLLYYRHDIESALEQLRAAVHSRPGFAMARLNLGKALAARQDFAAAEAELRSAIAIAPELAAAHLNLGLVLAAGKEKMSAEARKELEMGLRLDPRLRDAIPQPYLATLQ